MSPPGGLHHRGGSTLSKATARTKRERKPMTKVEKAGIKNTELKVWCEYCSIRIAPNEEQITVREKTYHVRCYLKLPAIAKPTS
jgi:hypothetical protein